MDLAHFALTHFVRGDSIENSIDHFFNLLCSVIALQQAIQVACLMDQGPL